MNSFVRGARMLGGMILFLWLINVFEVANAASAAKKMQNSPCEVPDGTNAAQAEKDAKQGGHMVSGAGTVEGPRTNTASQTGHGGSHTRNG